MGPVAAGTKCVNGKMDFARRDRIISRNPGETEELKEHEDEFEAQERANPGWGLNTGH